jgi:orotate phosphoribosyltransferase-like protein
MGATTGVTIAQAVALTNAAIEELAVGPERVTAADPAQVRVDWDDCPVQSRRMKMFHIRAALSSEMSRYMHQMPEVLLVADDGVVTSLFASAVGTKVGA